MSESTKKEVPGTRWRLLAHRGGEPVELENQGVIDEVVIDDWLHLEQMDTSQWWMRLGDARVLITIAEDGRAHVDIERGSYGDVHGETKGA
jgi:hypothetical protein